MITEDDLRAALRADAADVDARTALRPPDPRAVPHRRALPVWAAAVAAALVLVLAVGVTALATGVVRPPWSHGAGDPGDVTVAPAASGRSTGFVPRSRFDVRPVGDLVVASRSFTADRQDVWFDVLAPAGTVPAGVTTAFQGVGLVTFWEPGAYDASSVRDGESVDVDGVVGWYGDQTVETAPGVTDQGPALAWQYAAGAWAVAFGLQPEHRTVSFERSLAGSVVTSTSAVSVPVRLTAAPAGLVRQALTIDYDLPGAGDARAPAAGTTTYAMSYTTSPGRGDDVAYTASVTVLSAAQASATATTSPDPSTPEPSSTDAVRLGDVTLDHRDYRVDRVQVDNSTQVTATSPGARVAVSLFWRDSLTPALDPRWLDFTPASPLDDPAAWFAAADAFP